MPVLRDCPSCGRQLRLPDDAAGRHVRCPACNKTFAAAPTGAAPADEDVLPVVGEDEPGKGRPRGGRGVLVLGLIALGLGLPGLAVGAVPSVSPLGLACSLPGYLLGIGGALFALARRRGGLAFAAAGTALNLLAVVVAVAVTAVTGGPFRPPAATAERPAAATGKTAAAVPAWGERVDPNGDCTFRAEGDQLTIAVPGTAHDLSAEAGRTNAPRVLRDVTGDFTAHVTVSGAVRPGPGSTLPDRVPYQGAGLLLWHDANDYVRLERAAMLVGGGVQYHVRFELRQNGRVTGAHTLPIEDRETALRLVRRGNEVMGSFNQGGEWKRLLGLTVTYPPEVRVGVTAINSSRQPLAPRFEDFRVTTP